MNQCKLQDVQSTPGANAGDPCKWEEEDKTTVLLKGMSWRTNYTGAQTNPKERPITRCTAQGGLNAGLTSVELSIQAAHLQIIRPCCCSSPTP